MSLPKSELSEILNAMGNVLTRLVDRVENDHEFQPYERRAILNTMYEKMCGVQMQEILDDANKSHNLVPKRGDGAVNDAYTGVPGEITVDMDAKTVRVHDGETTGGIAMARATDVSGDSVIETQLPTVENNYTWYRKHKSGWVEMGGMIPKNAGTTSVSTNFPLSFSITPNVILTKVIDTAVTEQNSIVVRAVSLDKFTINKLTTNNAVYWYACGISA